MADRSFTLKEKIEITEELIREFRFARNEPDTAEGRTYLGLKAIADDLRARLPEAPSIMLCNLEELVAIAKMGKIGGQYQQGHLRAVAEFTIGKWPTLRLALIDLRERVS